ncbi:MAG: LuxR C-terminal-related transcriptional regulator [Proteobacteria bacterium]|nr:LuxR C-terminal-related transcriptional regulator [Pseudomonadota bacterium]
MATLTEREQDIMELLKGGKSIVEIARQYKVHRNSVSRSLTNITKKIKDIEEDVEFLARIGFVEIKEGKLEFISRSRDPKALAQTGLTK